MDTPPLPRRKTIRLQNYDYSQNGAYFVTICTAHKRPLFGVVRRGDPCGRPPVPVYAELSEIGRIVESYLTEIPSHYPDVHLASYVIMPDHIHMILVLTQNQPERAGQCPAPTEESDLSCCRGGTPGPPAVEASAALRPSACYFTTTFSSPRRSFRSCTRAGWIIQRVPTRFLQSSK